MQARSSIALYVILIPLGIAILVGLIAYLLYRRRLDAAVSQEEIPSEPRHRGVSPAEFVPWILVILLLVWNALSLAKIASQTRQLEGLQGEIQYYYHQLNAKINNLSDRLLEAENPPLADYSWSLGAVDAATGQGRMDFVIRPGAYSQNTRFSLFWNDQKTALTAQPGGSFTGSISFDLFQDVYASPVLELEEDGQTRVQHLEDVPSGRLWSLFLPYGEGSSSGLETAYKNNNYSVRGAFQLWMLGEKAWPGQENITITGIRLVKALGQQVMESIPLQMSPGDSLEIPVEDSYEIAEGRGLNYRVYLDVENSAGYTVRAWIMDMPVTFETTSPELLEGYLTVFDNKGNYVWGLRPLE